MDFDRIYARFTAAKAADDFATMSDIIAQVNSFCAELAKVGRGNEIPPSAVRIAEHINVLIYRAMKLLSDGDAVKAQYYLLTVFQNNVAGFRKFFYMIYLIGRSFYAAGNFSGAMKIFERYEDFRVEDWHDRDEVSIFYRGNCAAMLGDFNTAARLYEQTLTINSAFVEAKRNLELALRGTTENLARDVKSLWNFPNWRDVPIFINARDRLGVIKKLIDWLLSAGYRKLIVLDNDSTYPPLSEYYAALERDRRVKVIRLQKNFGYKALWLSNILERLKISTPYVYTDPDVLPIERCPKNFLKWLMKLLDGNHELRKVGLGLIYDDITFFDRTRIQQFEATLYDGSRVGDEIYFAQVDTTFALYANVRHYDLMRTLRTGGDLRARHLPWYFDYDNLPDDERYYLEHADKNSVTTVKNFLEVQPT